MKTLLLLTAAIAPVYADASQSPMAQLESRISELKTAPDSAEIREKIIKHVAAMKPKPPIPEEARRFFVRGTSALKGASDAAAAERAVENYKKALLIAPWWAEAYFNQGQALQVAGRYVDAIASFKLYLLTSPPAKEAREVQDLIYALEEKSEAAVAAKEKADEEAKLAPLKRFVGGWDYVGSGVDKSAPASVELKLEGANLQLKWGDDDWRTVYANGDRFQFDKNNEFWNTAITVRLASDGVYLEGSMTTTSSRIQISNPYESFRYRRR